MYYLKAWTRCGLPALRRTTSSFGVHHIGYLGARVIALPAGSARCLFGFGALVVGAVITALGAPRLAVPQRCTAAHHLSDPTSAAVSRMT